MKKLLSVLLLIALFIPVLSSCGFARRSLKIGVSVNYERGLDVITAAVITDGDGSVYSCDIVGASYDIDLPEPMPEPDGDWDTPIIDIGFDSAEDTLFEYVPTVTEYDSATSKEVLAFEALVVGKTLSELQEMGKDDSLDNLNNFMLDAVIRALSTEHIVNFRSGDDISVGVAYMPEVTVTEREDGRPSVKVSANVGAAVVDSGDTVKCASLDSFEVEFWGYYIALDGEKLSDLVSYKGTKLEQRDSYGMVAWAGAIAEWYVQAQTYANTAIGKRIDELVTLPEYEVAGCTMYVAGYKPALLEAAFTASDNRE